jgi:hypothetical protein
MLCNNGSEEANQFLFWLYFYKVSNNSMVYFQAMCWTVTNNEPLEQVMGRQIINIPINSEWNNLLYVKNYTQDSLNKDTVH